MHGMLQLFPKYKITKPIRLIELFAGYGSQALALENLGIEFEHYRVVEFDKYATISYNALHDTNFDTTDIMEFNDLGIVDKDKYDYILTYSFPCTDLSLAGKQKGMAKGGNSGSSLLWQVERLLNETEELPQILLMENVPQVHGEKFRDDFNDWISFLAKKGYSNQWMDLNSKDFNIPQNRNRTFMVSFLGDYEYHFPQPKELNLRLKDMLEDEVDESYYLSNEVVNDLTTQNIKEVEINDYEPLDFRYDEGLRDRSEKYLSPTLHTKIGGQGLSGNVFIPIPEATKKGYTEAYDGDGVYINRPHQKRGVVQDGMIQTLKTGQDVGVVVNNLRIRKLTPRECFRLMGLRDYQIDKIIDKNSNTQLYKQAGNSIVVNVLEAIFREMI